MAKASRSATGCVARCCVLAEATLRRNHVAAFLTLLRNIFIPSSVNQDTLLRENAIATLAHLLQNVDGHLLDGAVLVAVQWCVTDVTAANNFSLLQQLYKYLLFDFRLWSRSSVDVRKGKVQLSLNLSSHVLVLKSFSAVLFLVSEHIQYLHTIIKDDKTLFRKKYGVQFVLDVIRTFYRCEDSDH